MILLYLFQPGSICSEQGKLSLGEAVDVAGLTQRMFSELLSKYNVAIFDFPAADLSRHVNNA
jgi:predicted HTH domain antitoxin